MDLVQNMDSYCMETALGPLTLSGDGSAVTSIQFTRAQGPQSSAEYLQEAAKQLSEYFLEIRRQLDFPMRPQGTAFQQQVWQALREIPYGQVRTYSQLAAQLGNPRATRAVGTAAGKNPCLIAIPCHRLLGKNSLGGFAAGLDRKQWLLALEARVNSK